MSPTPHVSRDSACRSHSPTVCLIWSKDRGFLLNQPPNPSYGSPTCSSPCTMDWHHLNVPTCLHPAHSHSASPLGHVHPGTSATHQPLPFLTPCTPPVGPSVLAACLKRCLFGHACLPSVKRLGTAVGRSHLAFPIALRSCRRKQGPGGTLRRLRVLRSLSAASQVLV